MTVNATHNDRSIHEASVQAKFVVIQRVKLHVPRLQVMTLLTGTGTHSHLQNNTGTYSHLQNNTATHSHRQNNTGTYSHLRTTQEHTLTCRTTQQYTLTDRTTQEHTLTCKTTQEHSSPAEQHSNTLSPAEQYRNTLSPAEQHRNTVHLQNNTATHSHLQNNTGTHSHLQNNTWTYWHTTYDTIVPTSPNPGWRTRPQAVKHAFRCSTPAVWNYRLEEKTDKNLFIALWLKKPTSLSLPTSTILTKLSMPPSPILYGPFVSACTHTDRGFLWLTCLPLLVYKQTNKRPVLWPFYRSTCVTRAPPVKNWRILLVQSFTAHMPLLMATSTFVLGRRCWSSQ